MALFPHTILFFIPLQTSHYKTSFHLPQGGYVAGGVCLSVFYVQNK